MRVLVIGAGPMGIAAAIGAADRGADVTVLERNRPGDTFGFDAVGVGDVDGDGTADLLITSGWSGVSGHHSGRVFIISSGVKLARP